MKNKKDKNKERSTAYSPPLNPLQSKANCTVLKGRKIVPETLAFQILRRSGENWQEKKVSNYYIYNLLRWK